MIAILRHLVKINFLLGLLRGNLILLSLMQVCEILQPFLIFSNKLV